ncbi:MAG TPA: hypothetical protein VK324_10475 [Tepidisphaeraceae bacterium]|nr:hypothetical protein [Tepidisphaeraceae bacterium]
MREDQQDRPRTLAYATPLPPADPRGRVRRVLNVVAVCAWAAMACGATMLAIAFGRGGSNESSYAVLTCGASAVAFAIAGTRRWRSIAQPRDDALN